MLEVCTLASGSGGNCLLVSCGDTHILVDAGISARRITNSLKGLGVDPATLSGILITHEHSDHVSGLAILTKQLRIPVYASQGTGRQLCYRVAFLEEVLRPFVVGMPFVLGEVEVMSFPTSHDTGESVGYALSAGGRKMAVVTDLGMVTPEVLDGIRGAHLLVAEANHDVDMVQTGPYPHFLKQRILGNQGHLSNEAGAALCCAAAEWGTKIMVLAHLSAENNTPTRAYDTVRRALEQRGAHVGRDLALEVAPRSEPGKKHVV